MCPPSATHYVLGLPELFYRILEFVGASSSGTHMPDAEARKSLAILARTCHAVSEPSLDFLWLRLDSLKPLIQCFSGVVLNKDRVKIPPSLSERKVIHRYTPRIRELKISDEFSLWVLQYMSFELSLPNLSVLKWDVGSESEDHSDNIIYIRPLLNPGLVALDATMKGENDATLLSFLENYPRLCPDLRSVKLDLTRTRGMKNDPDTFTHAISTAILKHENLEHLSLFSQTDTTALEQLIMSPTLKALHLVGRPGFGIFLCNVPVPVTHIPLRNIEDLVLAICGLSVITELLRPHDQTFRMVDLYIDRPPSNMVLLEFISALATPQRENSLESLILEEAQDLNQQDDNLCSHMMKELAPLFCVSYGALRPLMTLGRLRKVEIYLSFGTSIDDNELAMMAGSWPLLEVLKLPPFHYRMAKFVTFTGLLTLLACCPKLQELELPLDARRVPGNTLAGPRNTAITSLPLLRCPIRDVERVVRFLRIHLPSVSSVVDSVYYLAEYIDLWRRVDASLRR